MELLQTKYLKRTYSYEGLQRIETLEYPEIALREAILNAVIHRDYGGNTFFTIKVFDNSMELWNEGELIPPLSIEKLQQQHSSRLRNKLIANVFYRSGQVESWGRGTLKMIDNARNGGFPEPVFSENDGGILVTFKTISPSSDINITDKQNIIIGESGQTGGQTGGQILSEVQISIINIIKNNPKVSRKELSSLLSINTSAIQKHINKLKQIGILQRKGGDFGGIWKIIEE